MSRIPCRLIASFPFAALLILGFFTDPILAEIPRIPEPKHSEYRVAIHCSLGILQVWKHAELVKEYPIETGKGGLGKKRGGDHRTPVGDYQVSWMASRKLRKGLRIVDGKSWCKGNRFVHGNTGPALEKLWSEPYGGQEAAVISIDYPNAKDSLMGFTGECIHIHADKRHEEGILKKSYGCIHMYPTDARDLYELVEVGTPVKILP